MNFSAYLEKIVSFHKEDIDIDNYDGEVGYSYDQHLQYFLTTSIVSRYFCGLLSTFGILGTIVTIIVLVKHGSFSDTTNILLTSVAVCDLIYLLADFIMEWHRVLMRIDMELGKNFENVYLKTYAPVHNIALVIGNIQVAVIAVERLVAVLFPFAVSRIFTPFNVKVIIVCTIIYTITFTLPNYFLVNNDVILSGEEDAFAEQIYFWVILSTVSLYFIPMLVIVFSNIAIGMRIYVSSSNLPLQRSWARSSSKRQKELKLFKMLFIVCCVSFLAFSPRIALSLCFLLDLGISYNYRSIIFDTCFHIYASSNFIIYVTMSSKFAQAFGQLVCGKGNG